MKRPDDDVYETLDLWSNHSFLNCRNSKGDKIVLQRFRHLFDIPLKIMSDTKMFFKLISTRI